MTNFKATQLNISEQNWEEIGTISSHEPIQTSSTAPVTSSFLPALSSLLSASKSFYLLSIHTNDTNDITLACYLTM